MSHGPVTVYVYVYVHYLYIPHWLVWVAGMTPCLMAAIAWWRRFEQLWWISVGVLTEIIGVGLGYFTYMHDWLQLALTLVSLSVAALAWAWPWPAGRRPPRMGRFD